MLKDLLLLCDFYRTIILKNLKLMATMVLDLRLDTSNVNEQFLV